MAIPNPQHLFDQAASLAGVSAAGALRQVDLRRAVSAAYYAIFHAMLAATADYFVGASNKSTSQYALVYRSIDHKILREVCEVAMKQAPPSKYSRYIPMGGFGADIHAFATAAIELQEKRHLADYDPLFRITASDVLLTVRTAQAALAKFQSADAALRNVFLALLAFRPRS